MLDCWQDFRSAIHCNREQLVYIFRKKYKLIYRREHIHVKRVWVVKVHHVSMSKRDLLRSVMFVEAVLESNEWSRNRWKAGRTRRPTYLGEDDDCGDGTQGFDDLSGNMCLAASRQDLVHLLDTSDANLSACRST